MSDIEPTRDKTDIVTKLSPRSVADRLASYRAGGQQGMALFAVMDQSGEARQAGLQLRDTTLVIFGSPVQVTPVVASPAPKVVVPRQRRETRSPVLPKVLYCMVFPIPWTSLSQARARRLGRSLQLMLSP